MHRIHALVGAGAAALALSLATALPAIAATHHAKPKVVHRAPPKHHASSSIPQHNGGDMDSDNNGGPSDGDGNI